MLKQNLSFKLQQKLSPQQIQLMKMLQLPTVEMEERIKQEIEENPALEEGEEGDSETDVETELNTEAEADATVQKMLLIRLAHCEFDNRFTDEPATSPADDQPGS